MEHEKFKINFFKSQDKETPKKDNAVVKKTSKEDAKFKTNVLAVATALLGLLGMHLGIDYSGYVIFLGFLIHINN